MSQNVTKEDVLTFFKERLHYSSPSRAKISVHLKAQKPRPKRLSEAAAVAFADSVQKKGVSVDADKWREELFSNGEPLLTQAAEYWQRLLAGESAISADKAKELLATLPTLAESSPATSDYEGKLRDGETVIEDPKAFRTTLRLTDPSKPVVEWGDLPSSKL